MKLLYDDGSKQHELEATKGKDCVQITINGQIKEVQVTIMGDGLLKLCIEDQIYKCLVAKQGNQRFIFMDGEVFQLTRMEKKLNQEDSTATADQVQAPMPGKIVEVLITTGDQVRKNQDVIILESMKMETRVKVPIEGTVKKVNCIKGQQVNLGQILIELDKT